MMKREALKKSLDAFLLEAKKTKKVFYGKSQKSKSFIIYGFCNDLIIIEYDSYPKHYALEKKTLLDGIDKVLNQKLKVRLTSEYATIIEFSTVNRKGTDNKTSVLSKFYYSLHRSFLNILVIKENEKV